MSGSRDNAKPRNDIEAHTEMRSGKDAPDTSGYDVDKNQIRPPAGLIILISVLGIAAVVVFALLRYVWPGESGA